MQRKWVQHLSSVQNVHRKNSLAIDLSTVYGRDNIPNRLEMFKFIHKQIGIKAEELVDIQDHPFLPQVFVKVKSEEIVKRVEAKMKSGIKVTGKNVTLYGWRCDVPLTTVKLNGANPDTPRDIIIKVMTKYGKVESCDRGRVDYFKENFVSDGTWHLRMRPEQGKGLPSIVYFTEGGNTDTWSLIFDGKVAICWKCGGEAHRGDQCRSVRPKPSEQGKTAPVGIGTYCDVVKDGLAVQWQGMTNQQENHSKQMSLRPLQAGQKKSVPAVRPDKQSGPGSPVVGNRLPVVMSKSGLSWKQNWWRKQNGVSFLQSMREGIITSNPWDVLENEELGENGDDTEGESGDEDNKKKKKKPKRRLSNKQESSREVKSAKLDTNRDSLTQSTSKGDNGGQGSQGCKGDEANLVSVGDEGDKLGVLGGSGGEDGGENGARKSGNSGVELGGGSIDMTGGNGRKTGGVGGYDSGGDEDDELSSDDEAGRQAKITEFMRVRAQF